MRRIVCQGHRDVPAACRDGPGRRRRTGRAAVTPPSRSLSSKWSSALQQVLQRCRRACLDLHSHDGPELAACQLLFDRLDEIPGGRFVELEVAAAGEAERVRADDDAARIRAAGDSRARSLRPVGSRGPAESIANRGRLSGISDQRIVRRGIGAIAQHDEQHDAAIGHDGKRVTGSSRQRLGTQERQQLVSELRAQRSPLIIGELGPVRRPSRSPAIRSFAHQRLEQPVLPGNEWPEPNRDRVERFLGAEPVGGLPTPLERHELFQAPTFVATKSSRLVEKIPRKRSRAAGGVRDPRPWPARGH